MKNAALSYNAVQWVGVFDGAQENLTFEEKSSWWMLDFWRSHKPGAMKICIPSENKKFLHELLINNKMNIKKEKKGK